jgi:hypothetical protein
VRDAIACSIVGLMISPSPGGTFWAMPSCSSRSNAGLKNSTYPATAKPIISSGTSDSTLKNVIAAA